MPILQRKRTKKKRFPVHVSSPMEYGSSIADDCCLYKSYYPALDSSSPGWMAVLVDHRRASLSNEK
ncbi:hypothetical protein PAHAL_9G354800 [Panicum hallii]|uniref:Uncharacterized protein n=1 Tax=Panicum hallii TaxID=206008 RepID=A0A2T8I3K8_9POAL|nr:hypothetical protein PAHAL_9G354800 [Panicum hallii]